MHHLLYSTDHKSSLYKGTSSFMSLCKMIYLFRWGLTFHC